MKYIISTNDASNVINTIFDCVKKGEDLQKGKIDSWKVRTINRKNYLVHTPEQWADKGCLTLTSNEQNDKITVKFYYWSSYPKDQRNDVDEKYILGRFTELLMVHFDAQYNKVAINK